MEKVAPATKVITGQVRFSYLHVFEPSSVEENGPKKYSASLIISKDDTETVDKIKKAINAAKEEGKGKWGGKIPANLKLPLRDGDVYRPDDPAYANSWFINCSSNRKPQVIDRMKQPLTSTDEFYSGCYGRASLNFFAFNTSGNKGVAAGLNNLQKFKDGEPLGGRSKAEDDFSDDVELEGDDDLL